MTQYTPFFTILNRYPDNVVMEDGTRSRVYRVENTDPYDQPALRQSIADRINEEVRAWHRHKREMREREQQLRDEATETASTTPEDNESCSEDGGDDGIAWLDEDEMTLTDAESETSQDPEEIVVEPNDIELVEVKDGTNVKVEPFPRTVRCEDGHFELAEPNDVLNENLRCHCDELHDHQTTIYPIILVCPRCAYIEHAGPAFDPEDETDTLGVHLPDIPAWNQSPYDGLSMRDLSCPEADCDGHLHIQNYDDVSSTEFVCQTNHSHRWELEARCPRCHLQETSDDPEITSEMKPKVSDATTTRPRLIKDIYSDRGEGYDQLDQANQDQRETDPYHWRMDDLEEVPDEILQTNYAIEEIFTVKTVDTVSAAYGYESVVDSINTSLEEKGRFMRTFRGDAARYRAFAVPQSGRGLVFKLNQEQLLNAAYDGSPPGNYKTVAKGEIHYLHWLDEDLTDDTHELRLIPLLHAYLHALYKRALDVTGLEEFLTAKILIEDGALVLVEQQDIGTGGLTQLTLDSNGLTLVRALRGVEDALTECVRHCESGCPACVYVDDAHCHPFTTEVERYVAANALLDREGAQELVR